MRHSETMRAASRLLLSHPIVCLLAALAAAVVLGVLGPIKVVHAADVASPVEGENFANQPAGTQVVTDSTRGYSGNRALKFTASVTASHTVNCSQVCDVVLRARGGQSGGSPTFSVTAGNVTAPPQAITSSALADYTFDVNIPAGTPTVLSVTAGNVATGRNAFLDIATFPTSGGGAPPQCSDTLDNDNDGKIDYPADPGCLASTDNDETDPVATSARLVGAGDIGHTGNADVATGDLIEARPEATVFTAGDNAYPNGSASDYANEYDPAWGAFKARTKPSPGNHEYATPAASGYKDYFGSLATPNGTTYYAYDLGDWHIYSLDSSIAAGTKSLQYQWLQNDLATHARTCMAAYWHHAIASSGLAGNYTRMRKIFALLDSKGADLVLNGHDHNYERFANINSSGAPDANGMREIIVGTGGAPLGGEVSVQPGSEMRNFDTYGIVDINLTSTGYSGEFVPALGFGSFTDSFSGTCGTT
jgi:acid phosphatase type 7